MSENDPFAGLGDASDRARKKVQAQQEQEGRWTVAILLGGLLAFGGGLVTALILLGPRGLLDVLVAALVGLLFGTLALASLAAKMARRTSNPGSFFLLMLGSGAMLGTALGLVVGIYRHPRGGETGFAIIAGVVLLLCLIGGVLGWRLGSSERQDEYDDYEDDRRDRRRSPRYEDDYEDDRRDRRRSSRYDDDYEDEEEDRRSRRYDDDYDEDRRDRTSRR
jgi:hypothetical protein